MEGKKRKEKTFLFPPLVGWELELDGGSVPPSFVVDDYHEGRWREALPPNEHEGEPPLVRVERDGSLSDEGVELVFKLYPFNQTLVKAIRVWLKFLGSHGYVATENCGAHLNVPLRSDHYKEDVVVAVKMAAAWAAAVPYYPKLRIVRDYTGDPFSGKYWVLRIIVGDDETPTRAELRGINFQSLSIREIVEAIRDMASLVKRVRVITDPREIERRRLKTLAFAFVPSSKKEEEFPSPCVSDGEGERSLIYNYVVDKAPSFDALKRASMKLIRSSNIYGDLVIEEILLLIWARAFRRYMDIYRSGLKKREEENLAIGLKFFFEEVDNIEKDYTGYLLSRFFEMLGGGEHV